MPDIDLEDPGLEGLLKQVLMNHRDSEVSAVIVIVLEGDEAQVYSANVKPEILEQVGAVLVGPG